MFARSMAVGLAGLLVTSFLGGCGGGSASDPFQPQNLTYAAFATGNTCGSIDFRDVGFTDSFDSNQGSYASTKQSSDGNLGTNGNLLNEGTLTINGSLSTPGGTNVGPCPPMTAVSGNPITASGGLQTLTPLTFPNPPIPATPTTDFTMPAVVSPGTYGNAIACSGTYHFSAGTYNFNSIDCDSSANFVVDSGPVILGSTGSALNFQSGLSINGGGKPSDFRILYGGSAGLNFQSQANPVSALIYAPNADLNFQDEGDFFGAMVVKTVTFQSNGGVHYDRALANLH